MQSVKIKINNDIKIIPKIITKPTETLFHTPQKGERKTFYSIIRNDEKYINDPIAFTNNFNNFFTSIAETFQSKIQFSNKSFRIFLSIKSNESVIITATNRKEICKIRSSLNINKPYEPSSISAKIFHLVQDQISKYLATLCNLFFPTGIFLTNLKKVKIILIYRNDSKRDVTNWRPISLLPNINKILKKLMHSTPIEFLKERQIRYYKQFGLRKDFSTSNAILNLLEIIQKAVDDGQLASRIFIDLENTFDTVSLITFYLKN